MNIGVISDTHGHLDAGVCELLAGVDHILHGGDVGRPSVLLALERLAPVTAVRGNTDDPHCGLKDTEVLELAGRKFLLQHIVNPHAPSGQLRQLLAKEEPDVVVFGHTHRPFCEMIGGTLFLNPGYAGKPKFGLDRSVAVLRCDGKKIRHEFLTL
jgi:putative phosphoesterase